MGAPFNVDPFSIPPHAYPARQGVLLVYRHLVAIIQKIDAGGEARDSSSDDDYLLSCGHGGNYKARRSQDGISIFDVMFMNCFFLSAL